MTESADKTILDELPPADESTAFAQGPTVLASRYELLGLLGSGGMGTVYRARDRELDEIVALKVLRKELAQAPGMLERFRREVKLARKVTHVNVARTFDIGEHAGDRFLTMELVDGEPLSALTARGRLPLGRVLAIARAILEALAVSHDAGVVHGDLKPENVICAKSGRVVITDFGIARALAADPAADQTATGLIVGTPQYMAPEQVEGARDIDGRADLYALGCMLYRLITGEPAWTGSSYVIIAAARLLNEPPDPAERVPNLPSDVRAFVRKNMARDRDARFPNARAASAALSLAIAQAASAATNARTKPAATAPTASMTARPGPVADAGTRTLAVLPLANLGPDDDAHLAAGLTDDLIDILSSVPALRVRPRGAVAAFGPAERDSREIGRTLGVDAVVEGSLRSADDMFRATLRLVTVEDGFQLWAKRFDRPASGLLAIADEAAAELATVLASKKVAPSRATTIDSSALDLYLRGRYIYTRSFFDTAEAVALLRAAHERAPEDGRIASTYALALMRQYHVDVLPAAVVERARHLAAAVVARDPTVAEARVALALVHLGETEVRSAMIELLRALEIAPRNIDALAWMGNLLLELDRIDLAIDYLCAALAEDPDLALIEASTARAHALRGDWDAVDAAYDRMGGENMLFHWVTRARLAVWRGDPAYATRLLERIQHVDLPIPGKTRAKGLLLVARDHALTPQGREIFDAELGRVRSPRRSSFNAQIRMELFCRAGLVEEAKSSYDVLEECSFGDVAWLDRCPVLAPLRVSVQHAVVRKATAARAARALEALDASTSGLRRRGSAKAEPE